MFSRFSIIALLIAAPCFVVMSDARADGITRWADEKGRVHFSNKPKENDKKDAGKSASSKPYSWKDGQGHKIFSDRSPDKVQAERRRLQRNMQCMQGVTEIITESSHTGSTRVVLLTATWCESSHQVRTYLRQNRIKFVEYDIDRHRTGRVMYQKLSRRGVPVIIAGNQKMFGFRADLADQMLRHSSRHPLVKK